MEKISTQPKKYSSIFGLLYVQTVLFIIVMLMLIGIKFILPDVYKSVRGQLSDMLNERTSVSLVLGSQTTGTEKNTGAVEENTVAVAAAVESKTEEGTDPDVGQMDSAAAEYVFDLGTVRQMSTGKNAVTEMSMPLIPKRVSSDFGYRVNPVTGNYGIHGGIDLSAASGTPIKAVLPGKVLKAKYSSDYGYFVTIDHGDGLVTLYAHCSELLTEAGANVSQGDTIALVGSTGRSTGPHLHLEVRINDVRINPRYFLTGLNQA